MEKVVVTATGIKQRKQQWPEIGGGGGVHR